MIESTKVVCDNPACKKEVAVKALIYGLPPGWRVNFDKQVFCTQYCEEAQSVAVQPKPKKVTATGIGASLCEGCGRTVYKGNKEKCRKCR